MAAVGVLVEPAAAQVECAGLAAGVVAAVADSDIGVESGAGLETAALCYSAESTPVEVLVVATAVGYMVGEPVQAWVVPGAETTRPGDRQTVAGRAYVAQAKTRPGAGRPVALVAAMAAQTHILKVP